MECQLHALLKRKIRNTDHLNMNFACIGKNMPGAHLQQGRPIFFPDPRHKKKGVAELATPFEKQRQKSINDRVLRYHLP
jgi:hypothetical protein